MHKPKTVELLDKETATATETWHEYGLDVKTIARLAGSNTESISAHLKSAGEALGYGVPITSEELTIMRRARDSGLNRSEVANLLGRHTSTIERHWFDGLVEEKYLRWARRVLKRPITP